MKRGVETVRRLMDESRIEREEAPEEYCANCGGQHDARHCIEDVVSQLHRERAPQYGMRPAAVIKSPVPRATVRLGERFVSAPSGLTFMVTIIRRGSVTLRCPATGHCLAVNFLHLSNARRWRRVK